MISSRRSTAASYESAAALASGSPGRSGSVISRLNSDSAIGEAEVNRGLGADRGGAGQRLALGRLRQRVAALQGALGVVGAQRHRRLAQRLATPLQGPLGRGLDGRPAPPLAPAPRFGPLQGPPPRPLQHHRRDPALEGAALGEAAFGGGTDLADLLVEAAALALQCPRPAARQRTQMARPRPDRALGGAPQGARRPPPLPPRPRAAQ